MHIRYMKPEQSYKKKQSQKSTSEIRLHLRCRGSVVPPNPGRTGAGKHQCRPSPGDTIPLPRAIALLTRHNNVMYKKQVSKMKCMVCKYHSPLQARYALFKLPP